jgi:hypothetical protein
MLPSIGGRNQVGAAFLAPKYDSPSHQRLFAQQLPVKDAMRGVWRAMLTIRGEQLNVLEQAALRRFEDEIAVYSKELSPTLCRILGEKQLRVALRQAMDRAALYGFTNRGPMRLYIELAFFCGSDFDTDPQYPAIGELLRSSADQMQRAERIHEGYLDYLEGVSGPGNINVREALEALFAYAREQHAFYWDGLETTILRETNLLFPLRSAYVGEDGILGLVHEARAEAEKYGLGTARSVVLLTILKFAFGHGCTNDPLYPWISRTLKDGRIVSASARAARLERKAITWLGHVLARPRQGTER